MIAGLGRGDNLEVDVRCWELVGTFLGSVFSLPARGASSLLFEVVLIPMTAFRN